ncbi:MAG: hypothetical protein ABMA64_00205, partial [Myxococcota bacterium]
VVVGDAGILGVLGALDLVRRWYDETRSGERGFWVLVIPGQIRERQPFFNDRTAVFHLDGVMLPIDEPIAVSLAETQSSPRSPSRSSSAS